MILPKISIVTPSYNQGQYLEKTIQSVLDQCYPNLEYIIMDGGSTDNSVEIIKKYAKYLTCWVSEPDKGQSDAINNGFRMAKGDILAWINSDDFYLPEALNTVVNYFIPNPEVSFIYGDVQVVDENDNRLLIKKSIPYDYEIALYSGCLIAQPTCFFRREVLDEIGYLNVNLIYTMDLEYFIRLGNAHLKGKNIPNILAAFRLHSSSKTITYKNFKSEKYQITIKYLGKKGSDSKMRFFLLDLMDIYHRFRMYLIRAFLRGDFSLFHVSQIKYRILKANNLSNNNKSL